jgi:ubiquinone/menaquinone biosynthesis C-methylase UbiE
MNVAFHMTYGERLFLAPVTKLENALDVGTGTGIWAIDLGQSRPNL